jgi:hypothetical protein
MHGADERSVSPFSYVDLEVRVPEAHPLSAIRVIVNGALADLNEEFERLTALDMIEPFADKPDPITLGGDTPMSANISERRTKTRLRVSAGCLPSSRKRSAV